MSGLWDDLQARVGQAGTDVRDRINTNIDDYFNNRVVDDVVKIGQALTGNLTQKEIDEGKRGAGQGIVPAGAVPASISPILILAAVGLAAYLLLSKKRRG